MIDYDNRVRLAAADLLELLTQNAPIADSAIAQRCMFKQISALREEALKDHQAQQPGAGAQEGPDLVALFREAMTWARNTGPALQPCFWESELEEQALVFAARYMPRTMS